MNTTVAGSNDRPMAAHRASRLMSKVICSLTSTCDSLIIKANMFKVTHVCMFNIMLSNNNYAACKSGNRI